MSVVVAIKENDTIYFGADTLMTIRNTKVPEIKNKEKYKLTKFANGVVIGHVGSVSVTQKLVVNEDWFERVSEKGLDKCFIITEILPKLKKELESYKLLEEDGSMDASFLIAYRDKLYDVTSNFSVVKINEHTAIGAGRNFALTVLCDEVNNRQDKMLKALRLSAQMCASVSAPFVLIDTEKLEFSIKN